MPVSFENVGGAGLPPSPLSAPEGDQGIKENLRAETGIQNKLQEARFQKTTDLSSFVESSRKLKNIRDACKITSSILKFLFGYKEKNEIKSLQSEIKHQIEHYEFGHNESDLDAVKTWIKCARDASPKDKEVICNTIRDKLLAPEHQFNPNILKQLHELAGNDQHIQSLRDNYLQESLRNPPSNIYSTWDDLDVINARIIQSSNSKDPNETFKMQDAELSQLQTQRTNRYIETAKVWLEIANATPPKTQQAVYAQIQNIFNEGSYVPEILTHLNEQANAKENKDNPHIAVTRNALVEAKSHRFLGDFRSNLNAALNGSTEDKIAFIKQFEGNLSLNNQPTQIIQKEHEAIKALLAKDDLTPSNRVFLQQMDLAYEAKLNENNPKKMLELASQFIELEKPLLQQVAQNISQTKELSEAQKQEISNAKGMTVIAARIFDAICPIPSTKVLANKFETRNDAFLAIYSMGMPQVIMRFADLIGDIEKDMHKSDLRICNQRASELLSYLKSSSSNTALFTARAETFSPEELGQMTAGDLMTPKPTDPIFIKLDQDHSLTF